jgi:DNA-directed RNA polymerase specialized sigma24 family protein
MKTADKINSLAMELQLRHDDAKFEELARLCSQPLDYWSWQASRRDMTTPGRDDYMTDALLVMLRAIRKYDPDRGNFTAILSVSLQRSLLQRAKRANKKASGERTFSMDPTGGDAEDGEESSPLLLQPARPDPESDPEVAERCSALTGLLEEYLTPMERMVLRGVLSGKTFGEVVTTSGLDYRSADNAMRRIKYKASLIPKTVVNELL